MKQLFQKKYWAYWLLLVVFIASSWPFLKPGMFKIHDFTHGARIAEMTRALEDGHFPVRWSQNFGFGYGMPLFQFYGPLPFYIGSVYYWLTGRLVGSVKFIFLISNALSLLGAYLLSKKLFKSEWAGIVSALAFTLAPYRFLNLYIRGAVSELWGIMALPWIVLGAVKIINKEKWGWLWFILSLNVLFLSHNISTMIFAPFIIGVVGLYLVSQYFEKNIKKNDLWSVVLKLCWSGMLAVGLSAFYVFPAYLEKNLTQVEEHILGYYFNFRIHFLYIRQFLRDNWGFGGSQYGPDDPITFFLGYGQLLLLLIAVVFFVVMLRKFFTNRRQQKQTATIAGWLMPGGLFFLLLVSLLMTTEKSLLIWENISLLEYVQFPWRFLGMSLFLLALIAGWAAQKIDELIQQSKGLNQTGWFVLLAVSGVVALMFNLRFTQPEEFLEDVDKYYYSDPKLIQAKMSYTLVDYVPSELQITQPAEYPILNSENYQHDQVKAVINKTHQKSLLIDATQAGQINFALAYYPGWEVYSESDQVESIASSSGTILVNITPGKQLISLIFASTTIRAVSDYFSLLSILIIIILIFHTNLLAHRVKKS